MFVSTHTRTVQAESGVRTMQQQMTPKECHHFGELAQEAMQEPGKHALLSMQSSKSAP